MTIRIAHELNDLPRYPLGDLLELQGDLKDLTERNAGKLRRSIAKHGLFVPFFVWPAPDGNTYILDGHQRKRTLVNDGHGALPVPCVLVHADTLQEAKEKLLVISSQYGRITQEGFDEFTFDMPDIGDIVHFDALSFEFGQDEDEEPEQGDAEPQVDRAAELQEQWETERGQLWAIGEHRLLCGDSTVRADVERVMGGEKADFCFTDPPYGVEYTGGTKKWAMLENDDEVNMYAASLPLIYEFTTDKCALYCAFASAKAYSVYSAFYDNKYEQRALIIWNKNHAQFGAMGSQYKQKHEPIAYCFKSGYSPHWFGPNNEVTVWDIDRQSANEFHPTQKPPELYMRAMRNSSPVDCIVYEPFAGSGTSLVACQNLNRRGRAIEISPAYCAVILQRMADAFPGIDIYKVES